MGVVPGSVSPDGLRGCSHPHAQGPWFPRMASWHSAVIWCHVEIITARSLQGSGQAVASVSGGDSAAATWASWAWALVRPKSDLSK